MDPNTALAQLRVLTAIALVASEGAPAETPSQLVLLKMAEIFNGLDEWLAGGGFLPTDWREGKP